MERLQRLYGDSGRFLKFAFWGGVAFAIAGAILPLLFMIIKGLVPEVARNGYHVLLDVWGDPRHLQALGNSFMLAFMTSVFVCAASVAFALAFRWCGLTGNRILYGLSVIPLLIPDYVFGIAGRIIIDPSIGLLANILPRSILLDRFSALAIVAVFTTLKWLPIMIVIADSSILAMGQDELFQIQMDFVSFRRAARMVYLPRMKEIIIIILCVTFLIGFRQHELAYELTSSAAGFSAETWSLWNYRRIFEFAELQSASIEAVLVVLLLTIPIQVVRKHSVRIGSHG